MLECIAVNGEPVGMELDSAVQSGAAPLYAANAQDEAVLAACAAQVRVLYQNTWENIIKIGATLTQAKEHCAYGTWGAWVANECNFTKRTAARYIEEYERFRDNPHVRALSPTHGTVLLGVPDEATVNELAIQAREEGWSSRELQKEITRRKQAEKEAEAAKADTRKAEQELECAVAAAQEIEDDLEKENARLKEQLRAANERADGFVQNMKDAGEQMTHLRMELAAARRAEAELRIVEKSVEVYPVDYDAAKEEAAQLKEQSIAQEKQIEQLRAELEAAKAAAEKAPSEKEDVPHQREGAKKGPAQVITAAQFGEMITAFLDRIADVARQQFDFMPASVAGEYLDQMARVERFCADLRVVIGGE